MPEKTECLQEKGSTKFKKGMSGNPGGRPRGSLNKTTRLVQNLLAKDAAEIANVVIDAAKGGDLTAAKLILERVTPPLRETPLDPGAVTAPDTLDSTNAPMLMGSVIRASLNGQITLSEAAGLMALLEKLLKAGATDTSTTDGEPRASLPPSILDMIEQNQKRVYADMLERKKSSPISEN